VNDRSDASLEEFARLRGCLNDLVSVVGLPATWGGAEASQIVTTLLDALFGMLRLTFVLARLSDPDGGPPLELARFASPFEGMIGPQDLTQAFGAPSLVSSAEWSPRSELNIGDTRIRVASVPLGAIGESGVVVAGSQRHDFPAATEALLIQIAANEAAMGLQQARLLTMQKRIAAELDERVAQRTSELAQANRELQTEIVERTRAEEALRRSQGLLAEAQRISATGSFSWRLDTDDITCSEELYRILELEADRAITLDQIGARIHPDDGAVLSQFIARARESAGPLDCEMRLLMADGRVKYTRMQGSVADGPGLRRECVGAIQDVTQRHLSDQALDLARSELARATRMMSVGALTASIAHEVNQPLSGIITNAGTCVRLLTSDPPNVTGALETARRTIRDGNRAADVVRRLRALFSNRGTTAELLDLNDVAREVVSLLSNDLQRGRVVLASELDDEPLLVTGDRVQLQQVVLNLMRNAADAMSEVEDRQRLLVIRTERADRDGVRLAVRDVGVGLNPETVARVFDAFYTTKNDGMGIGLSISRSIVERHGGRLWAASNDGPGATFTFSIPYAAGNSAGAQRA
jgi:signal transduction histidine kinase